MSSSLSVNRPIRIFAPQVYQNTRITDSRTAQLQLGACFALQKPLGFPSGTRGVGIGGSAGFRASQSRRVRVLSNDARLPEEGDVQTASFAEFITSERVKVVAMVALALALCNADRVVMSVAIVPLSLAHGWSRSFSGIVQVVTLVSFLI